MLVAGISLIPNNGSHTQNIPPITSVNDNKVNSAAGIAFDPIEYKINPNKLMFHEEKIMNYYNLMKKTISLVKITIACNNKQNKPANAVVVNFGVSLRHLNVTEKTEKPN